MEQIIKVTKMEVARRQIDTAIELYFLEKDPVSIHQLATAAYEVLSDLNKHRGGAPMLLDFETIDAVVEHGHAKRVWSLLRRPKNFIKHADADPDDVLDFRPAADLITLWEASAKYRQMTGEESVQMAAIRGWFCCHHSDLLNAPADDLQTFKEIMGSVKTLPRPVFFSHFSKWWFGRGLRP
jgi:hypothetical protein